MSDRPILFSGPMVRAILDGSKTQTRRVVTPQPSCDTLHMLNNIERNPHRWWPVSADDYTTGKGVECPYGVPGDRLWVRETWASSYGAGCWGTLFKADGAYVQGKRKHENGPHFNADNLPPVRWRPSIHMPRWASRLTLAVTDVRVERVQDITEADAVAEGFGSKGYPKLAFCNTWDSLNAERGYGWDSNPWVWAITFKGASTGATLNAEGGR
jgi:hypothetical protein